MRGPGPQFGTGMPKYLPYTSRFSRTVSSRSSASSCGTTPIRALIRGPLSAVGRPSTLRLPSLGSATQLIMRIMVDLPAPFGPSTPKHSPRLREKSTPATAVNGSPPRTG